MWTSAFSDNAGSNLRSSGLVGWLHLFEGDWGDAGARCPGGTELLTSFDRTRKTFSHSGMSKDEKKCFWDWLRRALNLACLLTPPFSKRPPGWSKDCMSDKKYQEMTSSSSSYKFQKVCFSPVGCAALRCGTPLGCRLRLGGADAWLGGCLPIGGATH